MAVANCLSCDLAFITAESWYDHLRTIHAPKDETVCALCERPVPVRAFHNHPCVGRVFNAARAAHPSNPSAARVAHAAQHRGGSGPAGRHSRRLRLASPTPEEQ